MEAEWGRGPAFAEVAETLGIRTDQVLAQVPINDTLSVLFTPSDESEDEPEVFHAVLVADEGGILREVHRALMPGFVEKLRKEWGRGR